MGFSPFIGKKKLRSKFWEACLTSVSGHEEMNVLVGVDHVVGLAAGAHARQPEVVVLGVQHRAGHVAVRTAFPVQKG
jgi:hypothetical protein